MHVQGNFKISGEKFPGNAMYISEKLRVDYDWGGNTYMELNNTFADTKIKFNTSGPSYFMAGPGTTGKHGLGIGTKNPSSKLEVSTASKTTSSPNK